MNKYYDELQCDLDDNIDQLINEYDETTMPLPDIEFEPHLLISKVRKHYMEYIIRLLSLNYETNQKLLKKNIYLPSAIWRCAKNIEMRAAQTCMVIQLYRKNIVSVIQQVKKDTQKGKLHRRLFECLHRPPCNEKKTQTISFPTEVNCQCNNDGKRRKKKSSPPRIEQTSNQTICEQNAIPVIINMHPEPNINMTHHTSQEVEREIKIQSNQINLNNTIPKTIDSEPDELMLQLEKMFQSDDDIFEDTLFNNFNLEQMNKNVQNNNIIVTDHSITNKIQDSVIENHAAQIKSLDGRLAALTGLVLNPENHPPQQPHNTKKKRQYTSKWHCEEYFHKKQLFDTLYQIGDTNRKKLLRIKQMYLQLFGEDSDDEEGIVSPIEETSEFAESCKTRISTWVVTSLNPFYVRGRIRGKVLYKSLAKHLIDIIYKCKQYPSEYEVTSFVHDFLENHDMIRCEADYKQFRIENVQHIMTNNFA